MCDPSKFSIIEFDCFVKFNNFLSFLVNNVNDAEDEISPSGAKCAEAGIEYFGNDLNVRRNGLRNVVSNCQS